MEILTMIVTLYKNEAGIKNDPPERKLAVREKDSYLLDGHSPIDNNIAENAIRPIALGRKNKINTWVYLKDVLQRIQSHPASRLHELLPDQWQAARQ